MSTSQQHRVAVLVPTINEVENLDSLLERIFSATREAGIAVEVVIADGGSTDGTQEKTREWGKRGGREAVRLVESDAKRGLAGDIVVAAKATDADFVVVMDADLSHPAEALPAMIQPLLEGTHDLAIGSRYVPGGGTPGWPFIRRLTSRGATVVAWPIVNARDPMSGFFAIDKKMLIDLAGEATGFKILLEILARGGDRLRITEVPIVFVDRTRGESKMGLTEITRYLQQMMALAGGAASTGRAFRFGLVGLMGMVVDTIVFNLLLNAQMSQDLAQLVGFTAATLFNYSFNARWTFSESAKLSDEPGWLRYFRYLMVCILAVVLRGAALNALTEAGGWSPRLAIYPAIAVATMINFIGSSFFIFPVISTRTTSEIRWRVLALAVVGYSILIRLAFAGTVDLLPEEAYYWNYAQHLSTGYLDHPPMVAWLIWLSTMVLGHSEFAVRFPAICCWFIMGYFVYRLTTNLFGKTNGLRAVMLLAIFPIYFSTGFLMTPDAPLYAAWAGLLYYLERMLVEREGKAWVGVGLMMGLGMLSKYTIALIGPAAFLYVVIDKDSRRYFLRPGPYLAVVVAGLLFLPVIMWNAQHDWASFAFQGSRRWEGDPRFSLHLLVGSVMLILTPLGAVGALVALLPAKFGGVKLPSGSVSSKRVRLFIELTALVPLSVFVMNALQDNPKLNWTGPVWLAALPVIAVSMVSYGGVVESRLTRFGQWLWKPTAVGMMMLAGGALYATTIGPPVMPELDDMALPVAWQETAGEIGRLADTVEEQGGDRPFVVGFKDYFITAEYGFYAPSGNGVAETAGRNLFGDQGLMWTYWRNKDEVVGRDVILVAFDKQKLERKRVVGHFDHLSAVDERSVVKNSRVAGRFYYRVGYGYRDVHISKEEGKNRE